MAIARVVTLRCLPGKLEALIAGLGEVKKILEGHGAEVSLYRDVAGGTPNTVLIVSTVDDWAKFAEVAAGMSADAGCSSVSAIQSVASRERRRSCTSGSAHDR